MPTLYSWQGLSLSALLAQGGEVIEVGDTVLVKGRNGAPERARITAIDLCSRPGEKYGIAVNAVHRHDLSRCCVSLDNGHWKYGNEVTLLDAAEERKAA